MKATTLLFILLAGAAAPAAAAGDEIQRIRGEGPFERQLLARGQCSDTFRHLVTGISASDLIVYVTVRRSLNPSLSGGLLFVAATPGARILRVLLDTKVDRNQMAATLGHELQHALEVARAPEIRTRTVFETFYHQQGVPSGVANAHDTTEAREIERVIRAELGRSVVGSTSGEADWCAQQDSH